jgi:hypothetical protein
MPALSYDHVNVVGFNIPHHLFIIKTLMDFSLSKKIARYYRVDGFIADVRSIFQNTAPLKDDYIVKVMVKRL